MRGSKTSSFSAPFLNRNVVKGTRGQNESRQSQARMILPRMYNASRDLPPEKAVSPKALRKTLAEMAAHLPTDEQSFLAIHGVGAHKLERYGSQFMAEIKAFGNEQPVG